MALKQMSLARMGQYRPPVRAIGDGGKTGRMKLLHNGTGHGLTGGGGLNAKGTGGGIKVSKEMKPMQRQLRKSKYASNKFNAMKINEREKNRAKRAEEKTNTTGGTPMNPHPTGSFMYGNNQWGYINPRGMVDWTSQKPKAGRPVIGFNQALPWLQRNPQGRQVAQQYLQQRKVAPAQYHDPLYTRYMANARLAKENALADARHQQSQVNHEFDYAVKGLQQDYSDNTHQANAELGAGNIASSGQATSMLSEIARLFELAQAKNQAQKALSDTEISTAMQQASTGFDVEKAGQESMARERWLATHQGQKLAPSKNNKVYNEGGITYRQNQWGVPQTWTQAKAAAKKTKTFTAGNGKVLPYRGK
jgi:hypothetical protein